MTRSRHFLWIASSAADAAAINPNGIKTLLANAWSTFFIKDNPVFSKGPKSMPRNPPNYSILCNWAFDNFLLADESLSKALRSLESCVLVNSNLSRKLFLSLESPATFEEIFKVTSGPFFFISDSKLCCVSVSI